MQLHRKEKSFLLGFKLQHSEFKCKCDNERCHYTLVSSLLMTRWYAFRKAMGTPIPVTSGFRCQTHNEKVGGKPESYHTLGMAIDISYKGFPQRTKDKFIEEAAKYFTFTLDYPNQEFIHCHVVDL